MKNEEEKKEEVVNTENENKEIENDTEKTLDEHMEENKKKVKTSINWRNVFAYFLMSVIVIGCVLLLVHFCEASIKDFENRKNTTTIQRYELISNKPVTTSGVTLVTTTRLQTAATHTYFPGNNPRPTNTKITRSNAVYKKSTVPKTTSTKSTTTSKSDKDDDDKTTKPTEPTEPDEPEEPTKPEEDPVEGEQQD